MKINISIFSLLLFLNLGLAAAQERSFPVAPGGELRLRTTNGDVNIRLGEGSTIILNTSELSEQNLKVDASSSLVSIDYEGGRGWDDDSFDLQVPRRISLDIQTGSGDVTIEGDLEGNLSISTQGGDIEFGSVQGEARVRSSGGDIEGGSIAGNSEIKTQGGDIELGTIGGLLEVDTQGGDIEVADVGGPVRARTLGGDVEIGDVSGDADVSTLGGDIELGHVSSRATVKTSGGDIQLQSAGGPVLAETSGGDITIYDVAGSVEALTAGGDIEVSISAQTSGSSRLASKGGDITLTLGSGVSATIEAKIRISGRWSDDDYEIESDFPAASRQQPLEATEPTEKRAVFQVGGGGPTISLETVNGSIYIKRR